MTTGAQDMQVLVCEATAAGELARLAVIGSRRCRDDWSGEMTNWKITGEVLVAKFVPPRTRRKGCRCPRRAPMCSRWPGSGTEAGRAEKNVPAARAARVEAHRSGRGARPEDVATMAVSVTGGLADGSGEETRAVQVGTG